MKKFLIAFVFVLSALSMMAGDAEARRFGGGMSFGRQSMNIGRTAPMGRSMSQQQASQQNAAQNQQAAAAAAQQRPGGRWGGMLGGALLGLGLGALLSHMGIGGDMAGMISTFLMIAIIVLVARFLLRRFSRRQEDAYAGYRRQGQDGSGWQGQNGQGYQGGQNFGGGSMTPEIGSGIGQAGSGASANQTDNWNIPSDFDVTGFLRMAKTTYIRMQASWDKGNLRDISEFVTPEVFAEVKQQMVERGSAENVTDVISLDTDLLGVETYQDCHVAVVKYTGKIREEIGGRAEDVEEVWNFIRYTDDPAGKWYVAGVQQL